jgi:ribosomal protein S12 methylthiotransferase
MYNEGSRFSMKGRTKGDAPQIDGVAHVATRRPLRAGAGAYDLWGTAA